MKIKYIEFKSIANALYELSCRNSCGGERARRIVTGILTQDVNVEMPQELYEEIITLVGEAGLSSREYSSCGEADYM